MEIEGVAVDIDGTITDKKRSLNCRAVEALRRLKVPVVLATGNMPCFARTAAKLIGVSDTVICENGGVVRFEYDGDDVVLGDKEKCYRALEVIRSRYEVELLDDAFRKSEICLRRTFPREEAERMVEGMGVRILDSGFAYHIVDAEVSKGKALRYVADHLGLDVGKFVAIGDSHNDIDMLEVAGIGVAVANADVELKRVADIVTSKPNGDGVVEALEFLGLI
ncbi:phosphoglycolate phosphatase [Geoglobus ahangari]|uniref:Phosphoglycolate phosphatase n=1 Tax=Geoglobus ahangari TaxID=113653 RepID=A0A0F7IHD8_9EURY|nr:phosphoglycolate phosphatase [Geoglobus ahangari]AKG91450.1 phosphoglycolate phosphatase [Geoglobus ahangari]NOY11607.1 phosphoglycolate phosphatase [Archaeoglobi archaeon]